jgi:hypothetical protein
MSTAAGFELPRAAPLLHFARRVDVHAWPAFAVDRSSSNAR